MSDNTTLNTGAGGDTIATDDCAGVKYQIVKIADGTADATTVVKADNGVAANALRVTIASDSTGVIGVTDNGGSLTVDGTVAVTGVSTAAKQPALGTAGTASADVISVQGIAAMTPIQVGDNSGSLTVDNGGTFAVQATIAAGATAIAKAEDVASADADVGVPALAVRKASPANTSGTDGDYEFLQMSAGRLWASATIDAALPAGANAIGKLAANSGVDIGDVDVTTVGTITPGTAATSLGKAEDAAHASGDVGVMALSVRQDAAAALAGTDADYQPLITDASGRLHVNVGNTVTVGSHAVTNAGTFAVQNTAQASTNTQEIVGDVADDAPAAGNPVLVCGVAVETDGTDPTTVSAEGDAAYLRTDRARRLLVSEHHPRSFFTSADYSSAQTNTSVQAAPGASLSLYITDIVISNGATAGKITLLDGSGGTVKFSIYPAINGGAAVSLKQPIRLTANTALCITSTTVTTHSVNVGGYTAP